MGRALHLQAGDKTMNDAERGTSKSNARASLLALRKPSASMIRAALTVELPERRRLTELEAMLVWERMVDAAVLE